MKLSDTILLLRNGYTKSEINEMNADTGEDDISSLKARIVELQNALSVSQKENLKNSSIDTPEETPVNLNFLLKGETKK